MKNHSQNLLVTFVVLFGLRLVFSGGQEMSQIIGNALIPLFNSHLVVKYINSERVKKNPLSAMLIVGVVSLPVMMSVLMLVAIVIAIGINKILNRKGS
jgi:hypothetical protein